MAIAWNSADLDMESSSSSWDPVLEMAAIFRRRKRLKVLGGRYGSEGNVGAYSQMTLRSFAFIQLAPDWRHRCPVKFCPVSTARLLRVPNRSFAPARQGKAISGFSVVT
mmetsp:Transcript_26571/g.59975  ORF Transcript_26571/g.59975 Transcript_26571/m.59975 type:complete len:109 (+) Transcript_26571:645-971(+)